MFGLIGGDTGFLSDIGRACFNGDRVSAVCSIGKNESVVDDISGNAGFVGGGVNFVDSVFKGAGIDDDVVAVNFDSTAGDGGIIRDVICAGESSFRADLSDSSGATHG